MGIFDRLKYAFAVAVVAVGCTMVADIVFKFGLENAIFSPLFVLPVMVVGYVAAPWLGTLLPYGRGEGK